MQGRRNPYVAREGIPFLLLAVAALWLVATLYDLAYAIFPVIAFVIFFLVFRDPRREVPASPLGIVSPVDGVVVKILPTDAGVVQGEAHRVVIRIDAFGTYTARSPVEGNVLDLHSAPGEQVADYPTNALWLRTDEGQDVVLYFNGYRFGLPPESFTRYGERLGQGQRCAYLRLTRYAEVHMPINSLVLAKAGQRVSAGTDIIATLPKP